MRARVCGCAPVKNPPPPVPPPQVIITKIAKSVTLLFRKGHWPIPRYIGRRGVRDFMFNRHVGWQLRPYYGDGVLARLGNLLRAPARKLFWWRMTEQFNK